ncbi:MAG: ATP-binding protein [Candidatus Zixiibacteriota bacterium]
MNKNRSGKNSLSEILQNNLTSASSEASSDSEETRIKQSLLERPRFTVKARLTLIFVIFFIISAAVSVAAMLMLSMINDRVQFVSLADKFANEIQSARRSEKNYFLYDSDLEEVRQHVDSANHILRLAALELGHVVGRQEIDSLQEYLTNYEVLVDTILSHGNDPAFKESESFKSVSQSLRSFGSQMLQLSLDVSRQERLLISGTIANAKRVHIALLAVLLGFSVFMASYISRHIISRLSRLMTATQRFASGDFLPITPKRKYQDEFSYVAIALNHMMYELNRRQNILVESHKLRAIGNLTAGIAHELNNPLNNIILTSEMLKEGIKDLSDEDLADMINDLVTQGRRAEQVVKNLLDFARESETSSEHLHIETLIEDTVRLAKNQIKLSGIEISEEIPENLPPIYGDRKLLVQVLLNLLLNAIDAMPDGGSLKVRVAPEAKTGFVSIHVSDTGCGIPGHILGSIFTPFFTTKPTGKGTGLGLAVSKGIIEKHGGSIEADSKLNEGTTVTVHLPIVPIPADITDGHSQSKEHNSSKGNDN